MKILRFIFSKRFAKHLLAALVLVVLIPIGVYLFLGSSTDHGEFVKVPDLRGLQVKDASEVLESLDLTFVVIDSVFSENATPGSIFEQSPPSQAEVKEDRRVYLTIYRLTPPSEKLKVKEGMNERVAEIILNNKGIHFDKKYVENQTLAGMVVEVMKKDKKLGPDDNLRRGERVTLLIGKLGDENVVVPSLRGLTLESADYALSNARLSRGSALYDGTIVTSEDSAMAVVSGHSPKEGAEIQVGSIVDLFLTKELQIEVDSMQKKLDQP